MHSIDQSASALQAFTGPCLLAPFQRLIPTDWIVEQLHDLGCRGRNRLFSPVLTFWACILKQMDRLSSRELEDSLALLDDRFAASYRNGNNFCKARLRLPLELLQEAVRYLGDCVLQSRPRRWRGLQVCLVDGTLIRAPRTQRNRQGFGLAENQRRQSYFPLLRLVLIVGGGVILNAVSGSYTTSEHVLFTQLLGRLSAGSVWIGDGLYASYVNLAQSLQRGCHAICSRHANRKPRKRKRLSAHSWSERWERPRTDHLRNPELLKELQETLEVRIVSSIVHRKGFRDFPVTLYTTLLDVHLYPDHEIVELYLQRWNIEVDIRTLKSDHGLARLTGKTPESILRELYAALVAFNGVRAIQSEAHPDPRELSHRRGLRLILRLSDYLILASETKQAALCHRLIQLLKETRLPKLVRLPQPRAVRLANRPYPPLHGTRRDWREAYHAA